MALPGYPTVNGNRFSWSSVEIKFDGKRYLGVKNVNYSQELAPGQVYGNHAQKLGRTRGELKPEGSLEMYKEEADELIEALGDGYMEKNFDVPIVYSEFGRTKKVVLHGCRIKKVDDSHSQGTEALTTKLELDVMWIERNGKKPLTNMIS